MGLGLGLGLAVAVARSPRWLRVTCGWVRVWVGVWGGCGRMCGCACEVVAGAGWVGCGVRVSGACVGWVRVLLCMHTPMHARCICTCTRIHACAQAAPLWVAMACGGCNTRCHPAKRFL